MTNTPYKDELIRIATLMGLPDEVEPTAVADAVRALKTDRDNLAATLTGTEAMRDFQKERGDAFREGLEDATQAIEKARDDLRGVTGAQLLQLRATATRLAGDLNIAAAKAETDLEEPEPPGDVED